MEKKDLWLKKVQKKIKKKQEKENTSRKVKDWDKSKEAIVSSLRDILAYSPPKGLFLQSADVIAAQLKKDSKDLKQAMARLTYYINRSGEKLESSRIKVLEKAKEKLRKLFEK